MAKKIANLYRLDLDSINNAISEINTSLDELDKGRTPTKKSENPLIWNERVEIGTTEITRSDLDIISGTYRFHFEATGGAAVNYYLYFNRDKTGANYRTINIYSANGAAVQGEGIDNPVIGKNEASGLLSCTGTITVDKQNNQVLCLFAYTRQPTDLYVTGSFHWEDFQAHEKVNHLSLTASVDGGMGKGSHFLLWKVEDM